jgi:hypothetical protein
VPSATEDAEINAGIAADPDARESSVKTDFYIWKDSSPSMDRPISIYGKTVLHRWTGRFPYTERPFSINVQTDFHIRKDSSPSMDRQISIYGKTVLHRWIGRFPYIERPFPLVTKAPLGNAALEAPASRLRASAS